jgi:hypothetical protein
LSRKTSLRICVSPSIHNKVPVMASI